MPNANARLTIGFTADPVFLALSEAMKVQFKDAFWNDVRAELPSQVTATRLSSWASFPIDVDASGMVGDADIVAWMNAKLGNTDGTKALSVIEVPGTTVRYVWINGVRYCEHVYGIVKGGNTWTLPNVGVYSLPVQLTLSWQSAVTPILETK